MKGRLAKSEGRAAHPAGELVPADHEAHLLQGLDPRRARGEELVNQAGQQLLHADLAPGQQRVGVPALRHRPPPVNPVRQRVAVDHRDALVRLGEGAGREHPGHAAADHHRALTDPFHRPTSCRCGAQARRAG